MSKIQHLTDELLDEESTDLDLTRETPGHEAEAASVIIKELLLVAPAVGDIHAISKVRRILKGDGRPLILKILNVTTNSPSDIYSPPMNTVHLLIPETDARENPLMPADVAWRKFATEYVNARVGYRVGVITVTYGMANMSWDELHTDVRTDFILFTNFHEMRGVRGDRMNTPRGDKFRKNNSSEDIIDELYDKIPLSKPRKFDYRFAYELSEAVGIKHRRRLATMKGNVNRAFQEVIS